MKSNDTEITARIKAQASPQVRKLNPHLFAVAPVGRPERKPDPQPALGSDHAPQQGMPESVAIRVSVVSFRRRLCDDQNSACGGNKALQDIICASLGIDDADPRIKFEYSQSETRGQEGTVTKIDATTRLPV